MAALLSTFLLVLLTQFVHKSFSTEDNGGWLPVTEKDNELYFTDRCNVPKIPISEMTTERFQSEFKYKPFILTFPNGKDNWCQSEFWTAENLTKQYDGWTLSAGKSIDIVYNGGKGDFNRTFKEFIAEMRREDPPAGDLTSFRSCNQHDLEATPLPPIKKSLIWASHRGQKCRISRYLFDRTFYFSSTLPSSLKVPEFLFDKGDPILFIGSTGTGATFHKHMPAWNGVIFGQKRWWLYPIEQTPPGGLYAFAPADWLKYVYPNLPAEKMPQECVQNAGEIFYVPESMYHAVFNIGETVAISLQLEEVESVAEQEFYQAMESHYNSTLETSDAEKLRYERKANRQFVDLHFLLPENTEILTHLSEMACEKGSVTRCERIINMILKMDPWSIESMKLLSRIYFTKKQYNRSEEIVLEALKVHPTSKSLLRERANFLYNRRREQSKAAFEDVLAVVDPESKDGKQLINIIKNTDFSPKNSENAVEDDEAEFVEVDNSEVFEEDLVQTVSEFTASDETDTITHDEF